MNLYEYDTSKKIVAECYPFYALIMAAMRQADTDNLKRLRDAFPETWAELMRRYNAPGGALPEDEDKP